MSSNIITNIFTLNEEIIIFSSESISPLSFKSTKTLCLNIDWNKSLLDCFKAAIKEWIGRIEVNPDQYSLHIIEPSHRTHGGVTIKYNDQVLINFILDRSVTQNADGTKTRQASLVIKYVRKADKILDVNQHHTFYFNDRRFFCTQLFDGKPKSLLETLDYTLPTRSEAIVNAIAHVFQIHPEDIVLDSFRKKYVITTPYIFRKWIKQEHPDRFYKYVSLQTYLNILNNKTFRLNSIVCQSDETESWYFENFLCGEYECNEDKMKYINKENKTLISSFTSNTNDVQMWKEYGDEGKGVMLGFESLDGDILSPIIYIDEESDTLRLLKENLKVFKKKKIQIYFSEIDCLHRLLKNNKYEFEKEWRLVHEFSGMLDNDLYYDSKKDMKTYAEFHDFPFYGNIIPDLKMALVSVKFGSNQRSSNISLLTRKTLECFGENLDVSWLSNVED